MSEESMDLFEHLAHQGNSAQQSFPEHTRATHDLNVVSQESVDVVPRTVRKRHTELSAIIDDLRAEYYDAVEADSGTEVELSTSDADYDLLFEELKQIEAEFAQLITPKSPTQTVGGTRRNTFAPV